MRDWDHEYANMATVEGGHLLPARWEKDAAAFRAAHRVETALPYGTGARENFDLVWPEATPKGLAVYVHGGYWMKFGPEYWTHLAQGAMARGWAVAMLRYSLAPDASIPQITAQIGAGIARAAQSVAGPIRLAGHSAGGHLVARMFCTDTPLPAEVAARVASGVAISGVHDLRPLMRTQMNDTLQLDLASARTESPALCEPRAGTRLHLHVGTEERPEFIRQSQLLANVWSGFDVEVPLTLAEGDNHFTIVDALCDPESALTKAFTGD